MYITAHCACRLSGHFHTSDSVYGGLGFPKENFVDSGKACTIVLCSSFRCKVRVFPIPDRIFRSLPSIEALPISYQEIGRIYSIMIVRRLEYENFVIFQTRPNFLTIRSNRRFGCPKAAALCRFRHAYLQLFMYQQNPPPENKKFNKIFVIENLFIYCSLNYYLLVRDSRSVRLCRDKKRLQSS